MVVQITRVDQLACPMVKPVYARPATFGIGLSRFTDAQIDHITGLLSLRDGPPIHLYATPAVFEELTHNLPVLPMLEHYCGVHWHMVPVAGDRRIAERQLICPSVMARGLIKTACRAERGGGVSMEIGGRFLLCLGDGFDLFQDYFRRVIPAIGCR